MKTEIAFWDTSAIIPLYCNQAMSVESRRLRRTFRQPVVWWGTHVEIHSGLGRLLREGLLNKKQLTTAIEKWENLLSLSLVVRPNEKLLEIAAPLTIKYDLRALDAFQLAAALVWCKKNTQNRHFICADNRLTDAASKVGFEVVSFG